MGLFVTLLCAAYAAPCNMCSEFLTHNQCVLLFNVFEGQSSISVHCVHTLVKWQNVY